MRSGSIRDPAERAKYVFPNIYSKVRLHLCVCVCVRQLSSHTIFCLHQCPSLLRDSKWLQRYMEQKVPPGTTIFDLKRYMPPYDGPDAVTAFDVLRDVHLLFVYLLCLILSANAAKDYIKRFQLDGYPAGAQLQVNVRLPFSSPHSYIYTCSLSLSRSAFTGGICYGGFLSQAAATHYVSYARLEQLRQMQRPILVVTSAADE